MEQKNLFEDFYYNTDEQDKNKYISNICEDIEYILEEGIKLFNKIDNLIINYSPNEINDPIMLTTNELKFNYILSKIDNIEFQEVFSIIMALKKLFKFFYFYSSDIETLDNLYYDLKLYYSFEFELNIENHKIFNCMNYIKNQIFLNFIHFLRQNKSLTLTKNKDLIRGFKMSFRKIYFKECSNDSPTDNEDNTDYDMEEINEGFEKYNNINNN